MRLLPRPVQTPGHVEALRQMRNLTAEGFANFNGQISPEQQAIWWRENAGRIKAWLYFDEAGEVGFGLIRQHDDGRWFTTVGILPEYTGHDFGKEVTAHLIRNCPGKCYGIARRDNPAAVKLHTPDDWQIISGDDPRLVYFRTWRGGSLEQPERRVDPWAMRTEPWPPEGAVEEWSEAGWVVGA